MVNQTPNEGRLSRVRQRRRSRRILLLSRSWLSLFALCTKSVSQLFCSQPLPHSFSKLPGVYQQFPFWLAQRMLEGFTQSGCCEGNSAPARTGASIDTRGEAAYLSAPMESLAK